MLTQFLKVGALIATGRFLKPRLKGLLCVAAAWVALWFIHSEYVSYVQLSGDNSWVLHASLIKTALYALSILIYVLVVERKLWPKPVRIPPPSKPDDRQKDKPKPARAPAPKALPAGDDGFDFLREKKRLRTPAEELLGKRSQSGDN